VHFESPLAFLLLLALPPLYYFSHYRGRQAALRFSDTATASSVVSSLRVRCQTLLPAARFMALFLLIVALARPQQGQERVRDLSKGIAIEMVLDRSSSMREEMAFDGQIMNRLEVVKRVFNEFVMGNGDTLDGRPNDLIGLVVFAGYADTIAPLTLGHDTLVSLVEKVEMPEDKREDGTAIGDAIALAAARLKTAEEAQLKVNARQGKSYEIKSKIMILLTDGQSNRGTQTPEDAAKLAKEWGIKIYSIGIGSDLSLTQGQGLFGALLTPGERALNDESLEKLAAMTGGIYQRADSAEALREIYEEIGRLETSEIESLRYLDYKERFLPFALAALALIVAEMILRNTWLRRHP
jgi:Ca-activated chloride channel family protein